MNQRFDQNGIAIEDEIKPFFAAIDNPPSTIQPAQWDSLRLRKRGQLPLDQGS
jgi:hypothetical protein